jgi:hypothetical protein
MSIVAKKDECMDVTKLLYIFFFVAGIMWFYGGIKLLSQSRYDEQHITWYRRVNLTRGISNIFLGLGLMVVEGVEFAGVSTLLGDIGWVLVDGLLLVPWLVFLILSWWNKSHVPSNTQKENIDVDERNG